MESWGPYRLEECGRIREKRDKGFLYRWPSGTVWESGSEYESQFGLSAIAMVGLAVTTYGAPWSIRIAPRRRNRDASPVLTKSESTIDSSASVGLIDPGETEDMDDEEADELERRRRGSGWGS